MAAPETIAKAYRRHDGGDSAAALSLLEEALGLAPQDADLLFARGNVRRESGDAQGGAADFAAVLALRPGHAKAHNNLGVILQAQGDLPRAQQRFEQALLHDPQFADAAINLGAVLNAQSCVEEALPWLERATAWRPDHPGAWLYRSQSLSQLGRQEEAIACARRALEIDPAHAGAHNDLGLLLGELGHLDEAVAELEAAVRYAPDSDPYRHQYRANLGLQLMQSEDLGRAWTLFEHRWFDGDARRPAYRYDPGLEWQGGSLAGRHLRIWWEQGLGDTLCTVRFVPQVAERFGPAAISLEVQPGLGRLVAHSLPGVEVFEQGEAGPAWDVQVPLMSLPARCGISRVNLPGPLPYLVPTPEAVAQWGERLARAPGLRVGLCWGAGLWSTGPELKRRWRSVDPEAFDQLFEVPGVSFISLQKGARASHAERWAARPDFFDWTGDIRDFNDTAALMAGLDLIITVDTSVMHLAGAMGKPAWVPMRIEGGHFWAARQEVSPWYPTLRGFRQPRQLAWNEPLQGIAQALRGLVAQREKERKGDV